MRATLRWLVKKMFRAVGFDIMRINESAPPVNINTRSYWNAVWSRESLESRDYAALHKAIATIIGQRLSVLDLGCGNGRLVRRLKDESACRVTGLDLSETFLSRLRVLGVSTIQARLPWIPCRSGSFDAVVTSETMEHLDEPILTVHEMHRIARTGGTILFSVPDGAIWGAGGEHVQCFTATDCHEALRPYVKEVHLLAVSDHGFPHLICWGEKCDVPPKYSSDYYDSANRQIEERISTARARLQNATTGD